MNTKNTLAYGSARIFSPLRRTKHFTYCLENPIIPVMERIYMSI